MITDSMERIGLYEGIIPYAKELEARYRSGDTDGRPFEVRRTSKSRTPMPWEKPVPNALSTASFAAKRVA